MHIDAFTQKLLSWLGCIHRVNAKWFLIWLNSVLYIESSTRRKKPRWHDSRTQFPGLPTNLFWSLSVIMHWKRSKTGWWEGLGMMLQQIRSVVTSYFLIRPNSSIDSLCQIVALQLQRHRTHSATTFHLYALCAPKLQWSWLQTFSQMWFTNQITNRLLNQFSAFTHGCFQVDSKQGGYC